MCNNDKYIKKREANLASVRECRKRKTSISINFLERNLKQVLKEVTCFEEFLKENFKQVQFQSLKEKLKTVEN